MLIVDSPFNFSRSVMELYNKYLKKEGLSDSPLIQIGFYETLILVIQDDPYFDENAKDVSLRVLQAHKARSAAEAFKMFYSQGILGL